MERKNNVFNATSIEDSEDSQYLKNNTDTCKIKSMLFKYGLPETGIWLPADIKNLIIDKHIFLVLKVNLHKFLRPVAEGEQDQVEAMLQENPDLVLLAGDVTDLSKRSFNNITGFQYAVWALDYHMWTMLLKYLKPDAITKQLQDIETGSWVSAHGKSASWQNLIDALDTYISLCKQHKWVEADNQWSGGVVAAQVLLPVHVVNEYCHPNRSFDPCPNFKVATPIPRSRQTDEGEWFTAEYKGDGLDTNCRSGATSACLRALAAGAGPWGMGRSVVSDRRAVITLLQNRVEQQQALFAEYISNKSQVKLKLK